MMLFLKLFLTKPRRTNFFTMWGSTEEAVVLVLQVNASYKQNFCRRSRHHLIFRDLVNIQCQQLDEMVKKQQAAEEERAKHDEEMKQRQVENDALLRCLMTMIIGTHATR